MELEGVTLYCSHKRGGQGMGVCGWCHGTICIHALIARMAHSSACRRRRRSMCNRCDWRRRMWKCGSGWRWRPGFAAVANAAGTERSTWHVVDVKTCYLFGAASTGPMSCAERLHVSASQLRVTTGANRTVLLSILLERRPRSADRRIQYTSVLPTSLQDCECVGHRIEGRPVSRQTLADGRDVTRTSQIAEPGVK